MVLDPRAIGSLGDLLRVRALSGPAGPRMGLLTEDRLERWFSYEDLWWRSARVAGGLVALGVQPGQRVGLAMSAGLAFIDAFFGCQVAGAVPVALGADEPGAAERGLHIAAGSALSLVLCESEVPSTLPGGITCVPVERLSHAAPLASPRHHPVAFVQYTSGTTRAPRGAVIGQAAVLANARAIAAALASDEDDMLVAWLPLSHDMGLVGTLLAPLVSGARILLQPPEQFIADAGRTFLGLVSRHRGTVLVMPPFAYRLLARRGPPRDGSVDLRSVRAALVGAEMIYRETVEGFAEAFEPAGLRREALLPVYGLAEATLGVCFTPVGRGPVFDDRQPACVSVGPPLPSFELRVTDDDGHQLGPDRIGEVEVRGPSVMQGYEGDPEASTRRAGAWLRTGDLGYVHAGELFLCGRAKDLIKRAGRSVFATEVEAALLHVAGTTAAAVFPIPGRDGLEAAVAMVESRRWRLDTDGALVAALQQAALARAGLPLEEIILVQPGSLPRTTSGKVRLPACRQAFLEQRGAGA
jgi:acyl-CoA synthetase (AMP-forming)/AMP-acid ligase II